MTRDFAQTVFACCGAGAAAGSLLTIQDFRGLEQIDDFFSASLFLAFMGVTATVGTLLITLAPTMKDKAHDHARAIGNFQSGDEIERRYDNLSQAGLSFLHAVYPSFLGLVGLIGVDGFLDSLQIQDGYASSRNLLEVGEGYGDELIEAIGGTAFLGGSLFLFFKGMRGLQFLDT